MSMRERLIRSVTPIRRRRSMEWDVEMKSATQLIPRADLRGVRLKTSWMHSKFSSDTYGLPTFLMCNILPIPWNYWYQKSIDVCNCSETPVDLCIRFRFEGPLTECAFRELMANELMGPIFTRSCNTVHDKGYYKLQDTKISEFLWHICTYRL